MPRYTTKKVSKMMNNWCENTVSGRFDEVRGTILLIWAREMVKIWVVTVGFVAWRGDVKPTRSRVLNMRNIIDYDASWARLLAIDDSVKQSSRYYMSCTTITTNKVIWFKSARSMYTVRQVSESRRHDAVERVRRSCLELHWFR